MTSLQQGKLRPHDETAFPQTGSPGSTKAKEGGRESCEENHLTNPRRQEHTKKKGSRHSVEFPPALQDSQEG